jgi:pyochelin biosynthetic protein PchC
MTAANTKSSARWLRASHAVDAPDLRLVCFPHAGGTAQAFRTWSSWTPPGCELLAVQYPGRQDRLGEACAEDMPSLVAPIVDHLVPLTDRPLVLFGHSMGANVAYEVVLELERRRGGVVDLLVVSGARAPHRADPRRVHLLGDDEIVADVRRLNESFAKILDAPELVELLLPAIRADYRLSETYLRRDPIRVSAPVAVFGGIDDPDVSRNDLHEWSAVAGGRFEVRTFPGGHFYLADDEPTVVGELVSRLPRARGFRENA